MQQLRGWMAAHLADGCESTPAYHLILPLRTHVPPEEPLDATSPRTEERLEAKISALFDNVRKVIVGKDSVIRLALTAMLARGHLLIEDAPGLGKTMLARALAQSLGAQFRRIQFTPDLLPSDVTGVSIFRPDRQEFEFAPGPVFADVLLADEINRTSPRTQSSLLESMEERQVTVDGRPRPLCDSFFVIATQNPIELEGTYPLPEAQLDRFLMRLRLGYPQPHEEVQILQSQVEHHPIQDIDPVLSLEELAESQRKVRQVRISEELQHYVVAISTATRERDDVRLGVSPRGSLALMRAAQAHAFLHGLEFVTPDSLKAVAVHVLAHRVLLHPYKEHADFSSEELIQDVLNRVPVPTLPQEINAEKRGSEIAAEVPD